MTAERWAYTVDRSDAAMMTLWAHSDGAGALVVGLGSAGRGSAGRGSAGRGSAGRGSAAGRGSPGRRRGGTALGVYQGAEFVSAPEMNGRVLVKYGGTRYPAAPPGVGGPVAIASSTPYSFGFGLITPPGPLTGTATVTPAPQEETLGP